jgi:hypothetical protein
MQKFKKHLTGILLISITVMGILASASSQKSETASNYLLPSDLDPHKQVLLIEKTGNDNQVADMKEFMRGNYPYKYEFVDWDDLNTDKYANDTVYRFVIRKVVLNSEHVVSFDFRFYDRLHDQNYAKTGDESESPKKALAELVKKITKKYR